MIKQFVKHFFARRMDAVVVADSQCGAREENQDNYLLIQPSLDTNEEMGRASYVLDEKEQVLDVAGWSNKTYRLAVADGMGGHQNGRQIAEALITTLRELPPQHQPALLKTELEQIHQHLWQDFAEDHAKSPGSTLVFADVQKNGKALIANVGDSRAFVWRGDEWVSLTFDQTVNEYDWRDDELEGDEYLPNSKHHALAQAMGYGSYGLLRDQFGYRPRQLNRLLRLDLAEALPEGKQHHADIFAFTLEQGEALLLASDGLWSTGGTNTPLPIPPPASIADQASLRQWLGQVQANGSSDNMTAVMVWFPPS